MVQKLFDFFYSVGSTEMEINEINLFGSVLKPKVIGNWMVLSNENEYPSKKKNNILDGGWCFELESKLENIFSFLPPNISQKLKEWSEKHSNTDCIQISKGNLFLIYSFFYNLFKRYGI